VNRSEVANTAKFDFFKTPKAEAANPIRSVVTPSQCVWKLPKSAKGKRFVVTITVDYQGSKKTFGPWKFKVR
jgi:hypothetical protein